MPFLRVGLAVLLALAGALTAGCGGPQAPPSVQISVTAPVDGATVVVPGILVLGSIEPKYAVVVVSGKQVPVANGIFKRTLELRAHVTRIEIVGRARGYVQSTTEVSVRYEPTRQTPAAGGGRSAPMQGGPRPTATKRSPNNASTGGMASTALESSFVASCSRRDGSVTGCECVWRELTKRGLASEAQLEALGEQMRRSFISKGIIAFPPSFKDAILACVPDFRSG